MTHCVEVTQTLFERDSAQKTLFETICTKYCTFGAHQFPFSSDNFYTPNALSPLDLNRHADSQKKTTPG